MKRKQAKLPEKWRPVCRWLYRLLPYVILLLVAAKISWTQMLTGNMLIGSDSLFHFNRIYEASQQLKHGNFSWFMAIYGYTQSGRVVNALYGPLFAYFLGAILLLVGKWYRFQVITSFLIYFFSGMGFYLAARKVKANRFLAAVLAVVYITIGWVPRWQMGTNFSAISALLLPYAANVALTMVLDKKRPVHWLPLTFLMTFAAESHLLTGVAAVFMLLPAWLYALVANRADQQRKQVITDTAKAVGMTLLLSLNTVASLLYVSHTNILVTAAKMRMPHNVLIMSRPTVLNGLILLKSSRTFISPYMLAILLVQIAAALLLAIFRRGEMTKLNLAMTLYGAMWLLLSSSLLPWQAIEDRFPFLGQYLQFPARMLCLAYPLLLLGLAMTIQRLGEMGKQLGGRISLAGLGATLILLLAALANVRFLDNQLAHYSRIGYMPGTLKDTAAAMGAGNERAIINKAKAATHLNDPGKFLATIKKTVGDYLPVKSKKITTRHAERLYVTAVIQKNHLVKKTALPGGRLQMTWTGKQGGAMFLPVVTYAQSRLTVNGQAVKPVRLSKIQAPKVRQKRGKNVAVMDFVTPFWLNLLLTLSLLLDAIFPLACLRRELLKKRE